MSQVGRGFNAKRPVDKLLKAVALAPAASQVSSTLVTATYPCTIQGIRWTFSASNTTSTVSQLYWAIVLVKDGDDAGAIGISNAADFYTPEQNVLAYGNLFLSNSTSANGQFEHWEGHTKTMRKLMGGDQIMVVALSSAGTTINFDGVVQLFCKT